MKYWYIFKNTLAGYSVYRLNFVMWRVRVVINLIITYFLWWSIFQGNSELFGYNQQKILTYVLLASFISGAVISTRTHDVGDEIHSGKLTNFLLKPLNYFSFLLSRDASDKLINITFSIAEILLLIILLKPSLVIQTNVMLLVSFVAAAIFSSILFFLISVILGFIGFWSAEVWAPRFILFVLVQFLSGSFFPLDIFPKPVFAIIMATPLPYLAFFPAKIYLGQLAGFDIFYGFIVMGIWTFVLYVVMKLVWQKGLAMYAAEGR